MTGSLELWGTLGPSCRDEDTLRRMYEAGMTGIRINLSHGGLAESGEQLEICRQAAAKAGKPAGVVIDMQGPELRVGPLSQPVQLQKGQVVRLGDGGIPLPPPLLAILADGAELSIDDGKLLVYVKSDHVGCVVRGGTLHSNKSVAVAGQSLSLPPLTGRDLENLSAAPRHGVTGILQPFCTNEKDLTTVRQALRRYGLQEAKLVAKIENREGVAAVAEVARHADEVCIARGDLGNSIPLWELPAIQKQIARVCRELNRPFGVATQLLHSMQQSPVPTRAEVSDIFSAVLDGAATLILTGETAVGNYPVEAITYLSKTAGEALAYRNKREASSVT